MIESATTPESQPEPVNSSAPHPSNPVRFLIIAMLIWCALPPELWQKVGVSVELGYAIKALATTLLLYPLWKNRRALFNDESIAQPLNPTLIALASGLLIGGAWIAIAARTTLTPVYFIDFAHLDPATLFASLAVRTFGSVALAPVLEELFWRGVLFDSFSSPTSLGRIQVLRTGVLLVGTSIGFALFHPPELRAVALVAGVVFGALRIKGQSVKLPWIAHGLANLTISAYVLLTHHWELW